MPTAIQQVLHFDSGLIVKHERTSEGFLRLYTRVAKIGDLVYRSADGTTRTEKVTADSLYHPKTLATIAGKPITRDHPPVGLLNPKNAAQYTRGMTTSRVFIDNPYLIVEGNIVDEELIDDVLSGKRRQSSMGYLSGTTQTADGQFIQTERDGNHVAKVERGRAGPDVGILDALGLKLDSDNPIEIWSQVLDDEELDGGPDRIKSYALGSFTSTDLNKTDHQQETTPMSFVKLHGVSVHVDSAEAFTELHVKAKAADVLQKTLTETETALIKAKADAETADASKSGYMSRFKKMGKKMKVEDQDNETEDAYSTRVESALDELMTRANRKADAADIDPTDLSKFVAARRELEDKVIALCGGKAKLDGLTDLECMTFAIKQAGEKLDGTETATEVKAMFRMLKPATSRTGGGRPPASPAPVKTPTTRNDNTDSGESSYEDARFKFIQSQKKRA